MKIRELELSWFRGSGSTVTLRALSKNVVVYGGNGSGKSSFVDAIEYVITDGRIEHLSHEYSGHKQKLGTINTHIPDGLSSKIRLVFEEGSILNVEIMPSGSASYIESSDGLLKRVRSWDLMRTVLRQDKVADFINASKGEKYSVVLPLLGLDRLETVAENLRKLRLKIEEQGGLIAIKSTLKALIEGVVKQLGTTDSAEVLKLLREIGKRYGLQEDKLANVQTASENLEATLSVQVKALEPAQQRHVVFNQILDEKIDGKLQKALEATSKATYTVSKILDLQIGVLVQAEKFAQEVEDPSKEIKCPACGKPTLVQDLQEHIEVELKRLHEAREARDRAYTARQNCVDAVRRCIVLMKSKQLEEWFHEDTNAGLRNAVNQLESLDPSQLIEEWPPQAARIIEDALSRILPSVRKTASTTPPTTQRMLEDFKLVGAAKPLKEISEKSQFVNSIESLSDALDTGEQEARLYLNKQVKDIVSKCSREIQRLWAILHPDEPIEDIRLTASEDKAIDVELKFFGVAQPSPRLTLSEGHRNSLSLCIFLALARFDNAPDHPIVLDDIVSSLDREHRGRIVDLLKTELADRQIFLFTHDREWYAELRHRLPPSQSLFYSLRPWDKPQKGIQFSDSGNSFDDARSMVSTRPESAGNTVRSIMDTECALVAEALQISLPFRRGDANDRRTCVEFLEKIHADAKKHLRGQDAKICDGILQAWMQASELLKSWANRASHGGSLTEGEARQLIDVCEVAVNKFRCDKCRDPFWIAYAKTRRQLQCSCGSLYWMTS